MRHLPGKSSPGSAISTPHNAPNKCKKKGQLQQLTKLGVRDIPKHHISSHAMHKAKKAGKHTAAGKRSLSMEETPKHIIA
jgi:hypothetical protein